MYRVVEFFTDAQDKQHAYNVGDEYPRSGVTVTPERIAELASSKNKRKKVLIELVQSTAQPESDEAEKITADNEGIEVKEDKAETDDATAEKPTRRKKK